MVAIFQKAINDFLFCTDQLSSRERADERYGPTSTAADSYRYMFIRRRLTHAGNRDHTYSAAAIRLNFFTK
jgi:hypothetical protein